MAVDSDKIKMRKFNSRTVGEKDTDGYWKVILSCDETIVTNEEIELREEVSFMGIDRDFIDAHETALKAYLNWMETYVYKQNTDSIIEGVAIQTMIEESMNDSKAKDNKTPTP
jgi:hypothetical protein